MVPAQSIVLSHVVPLTYYLGAFPTAPLSDGTHGGFTVSVAVHMWAAAGGATAAVTVAGTWGSGSGTTTNATATPIQVPAGDSVTTLTLAAPASAIKLWWPVETPPLPSPPPPSAFSI